MNKDKKSIEWQNGYQKGLDNSPVKNPHDIVDDSSKFDDWAKGYNEGYRDFINWVNQMCN